MLKKCGIVVAVEDKFVLVQMQRTDGCMNCIAEKGCGIASLSLVLGKKNTLVKVIDHIGVKVGDNVMLGLDEQTLLKNSLVLYILPLVGMFIGAISYNLLATLGLLPNAEIFTGLAGLIGLTVGLRLVKLVTIYLSENTREPLIILGRNFLK